MRRLALFVLAAVLALSPVRSARGDPILTIQFAQGPPGAISLWSGFMVSTIPVIATYAASTFAAASGGAPIAITSWGFTHNYTQYIYAQSAANWYHAFMSVGNGALTPFGVFGMTAVGPGCQLLIQPCVYGFGATGNYVYDPALGDLKITMLEFGNTASNAPFLPIWSGATFQGTIVTPEPGTFSLLLLGVPVVAWMRRRRKAFGAIYEESRLF